MRLLLLGFLLVLGCSKGEIPLEKKRPMSFYQPLINDASDFDQAAAKMSELRVLTSTQKYDMRYALFANGKFYYEVGNLGSGVGDWKYRDGHINLFAVRSMFNLDLDLSATQQEGESVEMQFLDRFGKNTVDVKLREPSHKPLRQLNLPAESKF